MKTHNTPLRRAACIVAAALLMSTTLCYSYEIGLDALLSDIKEKSAQLQAVSCSFTQERNLALFQSPIVFQGRLAVIRPDKLRWEFVSPVPSVLIFNGKNGMRCNQDSAPVTFDLATDPVMQIVAKQLWTWLDGDYSKLQNDYRIEQSGDSAIIVTPTVKETAELIEDISLVFDTVTRQPQSVTITEPGGDTTVITFAEYQLNPTLPNSTFTDCFPHE